MPHPGGPTWENGHHYPTYPQQNILTVLLPMTPSFCRSGGAWGLRQLGPRVQGPGAPQLPLVGRAEGARPEAGRGRRWRPLVGEQEDTIFLELQRIWWERRWRG